MSFNCLTRTHLNKIKLVTINYRSFFKKKIHLLKRFNYHLKLFFFKVKTKVDFFFLDNLKFGPVLNLQVNYTVLKKKIKKNIILKAPNRFKVAREKFQQKTFLFCSSFFFSTAVYPCSYLFTFFLLLLYKVNYYLEYFKFFSFFLHSYSNLIPTGFFTTVTFLYRYKYITMYYSSSNVNLKKLFLNFKINFLTSQLASFKSKIKKLFKNNFFLKKTSLGLNLKFKKKLIKYFKKKKLKNYNKNNIFLKPNLLVSFMHRHKKFFFSTQHKVHLRFYFMLQKKLYLLYRYKSIACLNHFFFLSSWFFSMFTSLKSTFFLLNLHFDFYFLVFFLNNYIYILLSKYSFWYYSHVAKSKFLFKKANFLFLKSTVNNQILLLDHSFLLFKKHLKKTFLSSIYKLYFKLY